MNFVVLIPAFHMEQYIERCLRSVLLQEYPSFRVIFVDDHSADGTWPVAQRVIGEIVDNVGPHVVSWSNSARLGILANHVAMLKECQDDEIAVCVDGDDQLAGPQVLQVLAKHYADPEVWMTYGSYEYDAASLTPGGDVRGPCQPIPSDHTRHSGWWATHLKTFRVWLFRAIADEDLRFRGEYIDPAGDVALMAPLVEMAGPEHARFIQDTLYLYNNVNLLSDSRTKPGLQRAMVKEVLSRRVYPRLVCRP